MNSLPPYPPPRRAWAVVLILMLAYISSFIDRQILSLLVGPIKRDLHLSDTEVSLLMGLSFALFYTFLGLPIGRWADRANRRNIIVLGVTVWSLMTALGVGVKSFGQFFLVRVGVGVGEATLSPAAFSLLSDYFPKEKLATAISVYAAGIYIGSGLAVLIGAALVGLAGEPHTVTLPLVGTVFSWQLLFLWIGLPGLLIAGLLTTIQEPVRRGLLTNVAGQVAIPTLGEVFGLIARQRRAFFGVTLGITFISMVGYGATAWIPTLFVRRFGWKISEIGAVYGLIITVFSTMGILLGGRLADRLTRRGLADGNVRVGLMAATGILTSAFFPLLPTPLLMLLVLPVPCFFISFAYGASSAAIQALMPNQARASASAVYLFVLNLIALGFGPTSVALLTDRVFHDEKAVHLSLAVVSLAGGGLSLLSFAWGRGAYVKQSEKREKVIG
jgi:MFS family permease